MSHSDLSAQSSDIIIVTLKLTNGMDTVLAEHGFITEHNIRSHTVEAEVQPGVTQICLPSNLIEQLGLEYVRTVDARTAKGIKPFRMFKGLQLKVADRNGRYGCMELPSEQIPLLGWIPLEDLGLVPDLKNKRLKQLPIRGNETYITVLPNQNEITMRHAS